ncbi:hypothetical protein N0V88_005454 [Collariella sp. IMI 366227]|nr:hypothetical protein N0V88_005454 [Collariella sp. IMI 366227]
MAYKTWQDKLEDACREWNITAPVFQIVSDRRVHSARFWYDGKNLNNAKEDAAEVALQWLNQSSSPASSPATSRGGW